MKEETREVMTLVLENTAATRKYPFTRDTLDKIKELRGIAEAQLLEATKKEHMVPAPVIIAQAIEHLYNLTMNKE